ncbi:MAG TPA: DUF1707 domain-containing protein [Acidimicrobiales bacterium]|nr:DUF1707 domain-containing protein [Acidimicrobiales bacterium]
MVDRGDERIGDAERDAAVDLLRTHTGAGRLTLDEFEELVGDVYAARTRAELHAVLDDLPAGVAPPPAAAPGAAAATPATPPVTPPPATFTYAPPPRQGAPADGERGSRRRFIGVLSGSNARGRWRVPRRITAFAFWGGVDLNFRDAEFEGPVVDVTAWAIMGGVDIRVGAGMRVELDGMVLMGGATDLTRAEPPLPDAPLIRVHARGLWGGVGVRTARPPGGRRRDRYRDRSRERDRERDVTAGNAGSPAPVRAAGAGPDLVVRPPAPGELSPPDGDGRIPAMPSPRDRILRRDLPSDVRRRAAARRGHRGHGDRGRGREPVAEPAPTEPAPGPSGTLTMMVTDVAGSTGLVERLGDQRWVDVLGDHNTLVRDRVARRGGTEVKAQGDGFLVVFSSARQAILAAVDVQRALARYSDDHPDHPMTVRIGLHTGEIVDVDGDVFGQNVVVAVRIAERAEPGDILVSGLTRDLTLAAGDLAFDPGEEVDLKGLSQPWRVHRVDWAPEEA